MLNRFVISDDICDSSFAYLIVVPRLFEATSVNVQLAHQVT